MRKAAKGEESWGGLHTCVEKDDIVKYYGNPTMPMQLRMLGEEIYGSGPAGMNGAAMRRMMISGENGNINHASLLSIDRKL